MAHFAKINEDNEVLTVLTLDNSDMLNAEDVETESVGQAYLETHNNWPANMWIQTSYNTRNNQHILGGTPFRGNYAGVGYTWDSSNNIFWPPKIYNSWSKDTSTADWKPPITKPNLTIEQQSQNDANTHEWYYSWDENAYQADNTQGWVLENLLA
jgi:hypothetical protein